MQMSDRWNVMLARLSRFSRHQVCRSAVQQDFVCRRFDEAASVLKANGPAGRQLAVEQTSRRGHDFSVA